MASDSDLRTVLRLTQITLGLSIGANLTAVVAVVVALYSVDRGEDLRAELADPGAAAGDAVEVRGDGEVASAAMVSDLALAAGEAREGETEAPDDFDEEGEDPDELVLDEADVPTRSSGVTDLSPEHLALFQGSPVDPPPEFLDGMSEEAIGRHYLSSDEWNPWIFYESIKGRATGGAYMGVGADQAYLYVGWSRPDYAWLTDYDQMVVDLHHVYAQMFAMAETPDEFLKLWTTPEGKKKVVAMIEEHHPDTAERYRYRKAYLRAKPRTMRRLGYLYERLGQAGVPSYLTDQATYDYVRDMIASGRLRAMRADLTGGEAVQGVAEVLEALEIPLRVLYVSNAEQYWRYEKDFRANIASLTFDDESVVMRTMAAHRSNGDYRYVLHDARDYQKKVADPEIYRVYQFVPLTPIKGRDHIPFIEIDEEGEVHVH